MNNKYIYDIRSIRPRIQLWNDFFIGKELTDSILLVETDKNINDIAGTFTIQLKPNEGLYGNSKYTNWWYNCFDPQDVIGITFDIVNNKDKDGKDKGSQFLGLIDGIAINNNYSGDSPERKVVISGRDFGALLIDDDLTYMKELFLEVKEDGKIKTPALYTGVEKGIAEKLHYRHPVFTPECLAGFGPSLSNDDKIFTFMDAKIIDAARFIVNNASSIRNLVYYKDKTLITKMLDINTYMAQRDGYVCLPNTSLATYQGNMLNFIRDVLDSDFNEIMVDTKDGVSYLRIRPKPFDRVGDIVNGKGITKDDKFCWNNLKTFYNEQYWHVICEDEVIELNLQRNKNNIYSIFRVNPTALEDLDKVFGGTLIKTTIDLYNLLRFGLRKLEASIKTVYSNNSGKSLDEMLYECRDRLKNWYVYSPIFESGQLHIKGREDIHIGDKIYLPWYKRTYISKEMTSDNEQITDCEGFEFYVTGVKNRWVFGEPFITILTIERGQNKQLLEAYKKERDAILKYLGNNIDNLYPKMENFKQ